MISFFRKYAVAIMWVVLISFGLTMFAGTVLSGVFSGSVSKEQAREEFLNGVVLLGDISISRPVFNQYLNENVQRFQMTRPFQNPSPEMVELLQYNAYQQAVQYHVLLKGANDANIKVNKSELNEYLNLRIQQFGLTSKKELKDALKERKASYKAFVESQKNDVKVQKFIRSLQDKVTVSDDDVDKKYTELNVQHLLVMVNENRDEKAALERITSINAQITGGLPFSEAVQQYSDDNNAKENRGVLGYVADNVVMSFYDAMHETEVGEITAPVRTPFGYHLIKVLDRREKIRPIDLDYQITKQEIAQSRKEAVVEEYVQQHVTPLTPRFDDALLEAYDAKLELDNERAIAAYQRLLSQVPYSAIPHYYLAMMYANQGDMKTAQNELEKGVIKGEANPQFDSAAVHLALAKLYKQQGELEKAQERLDHALTISESDLFALSQAKPLVESFGSASQKLKVKRLITNLQDKIKEMQDKIDAQNSPETLEPKEEVETETVK